MTDHASSMCWLDGQFVSPAEASISVFDHGLLYGDGVFEGIRFYGRRVFRLSEHLARLQRSAAAILLQLPYSIETLAQVIEHFAKHYPEPSGYVRVVVTRGEGALGIDPRSCAHGSMFVIADRLALISEERRRQGARLITAATRRLPADGLDPRIKSLNYLNHILARIEANNVGADEAVLLNAQGHVTEGTTDNIFVVRDGRLLTPPVTDGALEGITREVILELAAELGIAHAECTLNLYDLYTADECLLSGTGAELIPVAEIDGRRMRRCPGPITDALQTAYTRCVESTI
ncbi:branched-chain-amino-acid transaminase [Acidihalobacter ferrooxydans]|uniref:Branched-chain-amino-acid aminotransferase n=1 Tax=Acidihalobacter ferrooxydans TaxID=1765967 RepID=A0A1P8UHG3_9GAMM|nr:branched-chain-amino-acid transaminase [Acidihalobacter ferrooxydans]APZ43214.1 branched-chain-amino-acid transaminase [Acidihalobacter ferrooxydans]